MDSDDSYSDGFEIRVRKPTMALSSPFRFHMKAMRNRRKLRKKRTFSSSNRNRNKRDELLISQDERVRNISMEIDNGDKEESEVDELCVLQDALEATSSFAGYQQKLLLDNLKKLEAEKRKELSDEWKAFLHEKRQLDIKKLIFAAKLASTTVSF